MLNLDDIQSRFDKGQHLIADVQALLGEAKGLDPGVVARLGRGLRDAADMHALYSNVEQLYAKQYNRPTTDQLVAAQRIAAAAAKAKAEAARAQQAAKAAQVEEAAAAQRVAMAQKVQAQEVALVQNKAGKEKAEYEEDIAQKIADFKKKTANDLRSVLEYK